LEDGGVIEVNIEARRVVEEIGRRVERGWLVAIDYGYTARELARFSAGTLMSYRRHQALDDVLAEPGERDITAHVNFTALAGHAAGAGFDAAPLESLARLLLRIGERDQFAEALRAAGESDALRRRLQLKTLLYGMGETFRVLMARRD
jgi:SAM-dependent MidA family methyltransferase